MIQSISRNTHTVKRAILSSPHDRDRDNNISSRKQKMSLCQDFSVEPRVLMVPSKAGLSFSWPHKQTHTKMLESPPNLAYVHPTSYSFLSANSLEMCTESLGSETGSGIDEFDELIMEERERERERQSCGGIQQVIKPRRSIKKVKHGGGGSFPPPLTSISGGEGVRVRTHREGGRLVIKAFTFSSTGSCFVAERGNGRLRLSLLKDGGGGDGGGEAEEEEEEEEVDRENGDGGGDGFCGKAGCVIGGSSRCNGERSSRKRLHTLPVCVAIS